MVEEESRNDVKCGGNSKPTVTTEIKVSSIRKKKKKEENKASLCMLSEFWCSQREVRSLDDTAIA